MDKTVSLLDNENSYLIIKAASETHAEQLVGEYINEISGRYCCDVEEALDGNVNIEVLDPNLFESIFVFFEDEDYGVVNERIDLFGSNPYFVIMAKSKEHAEELVYEFLNEQSN